MDPQCKANSYIWKVPGLSPKNKQFLCDGFIRNSYQQHMHPSIALLITKFHTTGKYCIADIIDATKNANPCRALTSPAFCINSIRFYIQFKISGMSWFGHSDGEQISIDSRFVVDSESMPPNMEFLNITFDFIYKINCKTSSGRDQVNMHLNAVNGNFKQSWKKTQSIARKNASNIYNISFQITIHDMIAHYTNNNGITLPKLDAMNPIRENHDKYEKYFWEITDTEDIETIKNAPNVYGFVSPIFIIGGIKWYLTFYPNGSQIYRANRCNVFLHLAALPRTSMAVKVEHSLGLLGDYAMRNNLCRTMLDHNVSNGGELESIYKSCDLVKLSNFRCIAAIRLLKVYDNDKVIEWEGNICIQQNDKVMELVEYEWEIETKDLNLTQRKLNRHISHDFHMFGLKWRLILYPYGCDSEEMKNDYTISELCTICLELTKLPPTYTLNVRCTFSVLELNVRFITTGILDNDHLVIDWGKKRVLTDDLHCQRKRYYTYPYRSLKTLERFTIKIGMEIVDVYCEGKCITDTFMMFDHKF